MIRERPPSLIILDIQLPGMSGIEALRVIRSDPALRHLPVIAMSADAGKEPVQKALDAGCDDYLPKPIDFKELNELLRIYI